MTASADELLFTIRFVPDTTYATPCPDCPTGLRSQVIDETGTQLVDDEPSF